MTIAQKRPATTSFGPLLDQFVYFSALTTGSHGRAVKINKNLFLPFFCVVDPATHDGQLIIRHIEALRATPTHSKVMASRKEPFHKRSASHVQQLNKINNAFEHLLIVKNLHIYYRVSQELGDKSPTVYITGIRELSHERDQGAGLYEGKTGIGRMQAIKARSESLDGKLVFISGKAGDANDALKQAHAVTGDSGSMVFYSPSNALNDLGVWRTSRIGHAAEQTIGELVALMKKNQKPARGIDWYVSEEGASVLEKALSQLPGNLTNHKFKFVNAIAKTSSIINSLAEKNATLAGEFYQYERNRRSLLSLAMDKDRLLSAIGKLPAGKNYDKITRRYIVTAIESLAAVGSKVADQSKAVGANKTFVQVLAETGKYR